MSFLSHGTVCWGCLNGCIICEQVFTAHRELIDHMAFDHNFSVGQPDNLVFVRWVSLPEILIYSSQEVPRPNRVQAGGPAVPLL